MTGWTDGKEGKPPKLCNCYKVDGMGPSSASEQGKYMGIVRRPPKKVKIEDYPWNDRGNGEHLIDAYNGTLRYVEEIKQWIYWDGDHWIRDIAVGDEAFEFVRHAQVKEYKRLQKELRKKGENEEGGLTKSIVNEYKRFITQSGNDNRRKASLSVASLIPGVSTQFADWDADIRIVNCKNGIVELNRDGWLFRERTINDRVTIMAPTDFHPMDEIADLMVSQPDNPLAISARVLKDFLDKVLPDLTLRRFMQKSLGYCLYGDNSQRKLSFFMVGETDSGKSTVLNLVQAALGKYCLDTNIGVFKPNDGEINVAKVELLGPRIVTLSEIDQDSRISAAIFKRIIGGDRISSRVPHGLMIHGDPQCTLLCATNGTPHVVGADQATKRRMLAIPFDHPIPPQSGFDPRLFIELAKPAFLSWLMEGWNMFADEGIDLEGLPMQVRMATEEFVAGIDLISGFLHERTIEVEGGRIPQPEMYARFIAWCADQGVEKPPSKRLFGTRMQGWLGKPFSTTKDGKPIKYWLDREFVDNSINVKG